MSVPRSDDGSDGQTHLGWDGIGHGQGGKGKGEQGGELHVGSWFLVLARIMDCKCLKSCLNGA